MTPDWDSQALVDVVRPQEASNAKVSGSLATFDLIAFNQVKVEFTEEPGRVHFFIRNSFGSFSKVIPIHDPQIDGPSHRYTFPLLLSDCLQIVTAKGASIRKIKLKREYDVQISASSAPDRLWTPENLLDDRPDYGWAGEIKNQPAADEIRIDLGTEVYMGAITLGSDAKESGFPSDFQVYASVNSDSWHQVASETGLLAPKGANLHWQVPIIRCRYLRIALCQKNPASDGKFRSRILSAGVLARPENLHMLVNGPSPGLASSLVPGLVTFADRDEVSPNKAVQASDPRLRTSTTEYPGIIQMARDGQQDAHVAVQGNDSRLRMATTEYPGISELAADGEVAQAKVLQSNDSRIAPATENKQGIVILSKSGDTIPGTVVQASDHRLKVATESAAGIVQLARNGETAGGRVVQGNDDRLRSSSVAWQGIVQLAAHNEAKPGKALQSDDPRLSLGSEEIAGRVRFARDGEISPAKAVQSHDRRLQPADAKHAGIVKLAEPGGSDGVITAQDPRLKDARPPLPHEHDYAAKDHAFSSHTGSLHIEKAVQTAKAGAYQADLGADLPIKASNSQGWAAAYQGGMIAVARKEAGVFLAEEGEAVKAGSKRGPALVAYSADDYALQIPASVQGQSASGKGIHCEGSVVIKGTLQSPAITTEVVAIELTGFASEIFATGDILTINSAGLVEKIRQAQQGVIGVMLDPGDKRIGIAGVLAIRVQGRTEAGSRIGFAEGVPGVGRAMSDGFAVCLETSVDEREKLVRCVIIK